MSRKTVEQVINRELMLKKVSAEALLLIYDWNGDYPETWMEYPLLIKKLRERFRMELSKKLITEAVKILHASKFLDFNYTVNKNWIPCGTGYFITSEGIEFVQNMLLLSEIPSLNNKQEVKLLNFEKILSKANDEFAEQCKNEGRPFQKEIRSLQVKSVLKALVEAVNTELQGRRDADVR